MKTKKIQKFIEKFAELYISFQEKQFKLIKKLSDSEILQLIIECRKQALGGDPQTCFGFRVDLWDTYAANLEKELWLRESLKQAKIFDIDSYCLTCQEKCLGDDHHDVIVSKKTEYEMRIGEMSREELTKEILKLHQLVEYKHE